MTRLKSVENDWVWFLFALACLLVVAASRAFLPGGTILADAFHHGEYFTSLTNYLAGAASPIPLTIHGALDYVPAWIALKAYGPDNYLLPTWILYRLLRVLAAIVLLLITARVTRRKPSRHLLLLATAIFAPYIVRHKDLLLLLSILIYWLTLNRDHRPAVSLALQTCFGVCVALSMVWSFDRGIAGVVSLGLACIFLWYKGQSYAVAFAAFFGTIAMLSIFFPPFSITTYVENVWILVQISSQFGYGWQCLPVILTVLLVSLNLLALWVLLPKLRKPGLDVEKTANLLLLLVLSIFLLKIGTYRAGLQHFLAGSWALFMMAVYFADTGIRINHLQKIVAGLMACCFIYLAFYHRVFIFIPVAAFLAAWAFLDIQRPVPGTPLRNAFAVSLVIPFVAAVFSIYQVNHVRGYEWSAHLLNPPANSEVVSDGVRWTSKQLKNHGTHCVFDLSNSGTINALAALPSCSRFTYPVYAAAKHEAELIETVKREQPSAVVYSSTFWAFYFDGRSMHARFPTLTAYLRQQYPVEACSFGYCVRTRDKTDF